jgi:hypothetical protein
VPVTETPESARDSLVLPMMVVRGVLEGGWRGGCCCVVEGWSSGLVVGGGEEGLLFGESGCGLDGWLGWLASATFIDGLR